MDSYMPYTAMASGIVLRGLSHLMTSVLARYVLSELCSHYFHGC